MLIPQINKIAKQLGRIQTSSRNSPWCFWYSPANWSASTFNCATIDNSLVGTWLSWCPLIQWYNMFKLYSVVVQKICSVMVYSYLIVLFGNGIVYSRWVSCWLISSLLSETKVLGSGPLFEYSDTNAKKTVADNIPTPSAQRELPLPLQESAYQARIYHLGLLLPNHSSCCG